jgi:hypothetical protein
VLPVLLEAVAHLGRMPASANNPSLSAG